MPILPITACMRAVFTNDGLLKRGLRRVGVIPSGGNVDLRQFAGLQTS